MFAFSLSGRINSEYVVNNIADCKIGNWLGMGWDLGWDLGWEWGGHVDPILL